MHCNEGRCDVRRDKAYDIDLGTAAGSRKSHWHVGLRGGGNVR